MKKSVLIGALLVGFGLALASGGCSSGEPVMTEAAKEAERKQMEETSKANDAAAKAAARPRPRAGEMPP